MAGISDVARKAGVSSSTVSYVLSGKRKISESTRERVLAAIDELGYRPHAGARALASSQTNVIALVAPLRTGVDVNVIMQFVAGIVTRARDHDMDVLMLTDQDAHAIDRVGRGSMADAVIVMDVESDDPRLPALSAMDQPSIVIGLPRRPLGLSCIDFDFAAAGRLAVAHLHESKARSIALLGSPSQVFERHTSYADRLRDGFTAKCDELGLHAVTRPCPADAAGARAAVAELLDTVDELDGLFIHNEAALPAILATLRERLDASQLPRVVALGPANQLRQPGVSVIDIPGEAIGAAAVDMAMARLAGDPLVQTRLIAPTMG